MRVLSHKETPGLADKIEVTRSDWIKAFDGLSLANTPRAQWAVRRTAASSTSSPAPPSLREPSSRGVVRALEFQARQSTGRTGHEQPLRITRCRDVQAQGLFSYFSTALWDYNVALVQMLALCPALAVTTTATNGLGMGLPPPWF